VDIIPEFARLLGTPGGVVLDIEIQYQPLAAIIRELVAFAVLIRKIKVGRYLANLERFGKYATTPESHNHSYQRCKYREDLHDFTP
jgi:hypothetical protein